MNAKIIHAIRCAVVVGLLAMLPSPHPTSSLSKSPLSKAIPLTLVTDQGLGVVRDLIPAGISVSAIPDAEGVLVVTNASGTPVGRVASTLPVSSEIKGYRGPTEALLSLGEDGVVLAVQVLSSHDTPEHVEAVQSNPLFLNQFIGMKMGVDTQNTHALDMQAQAIDGVTGATLTSLAMAEGIIKRLGKTSPSLLFVRPLTIEDARLIFDTAATVAGDPVARVQDSSGVDQGTLIRTGTWVDDEIGYQGPTEILLGMAACDSPHGPISGILIRHSFDNQPYVDYVREESSFWKHFQGKTVEQLASWDSAAAQVEGVSGATMTSMAIAATLPRAAQKWIQSSEMDGGSPGHSLQSLHCVLLDWLGSIRWSAIDFATLGLLLGLMIAKRFHWMRHRRFRSVWLLTVILIVGVWSGNLLSLALLTGWASAGVSWHLATGLLAIVAVSILLPPTTKSNPYCHHLCPHGAIGQLIRPTAADRRLLRLPPRLTWWLGHLPATTLLVVYLVLLFKPASDISMVEPFHAYAWRFASWGSIVFAVASLAFSAVVPMGYCRWGCPTGRFINHLRRDAKSDRITAFDLGTWGLLLIAIAV